MLLEGWCKSGLLHFYTTTPFLPLTALSATPRTLHFALGEGTLLRQCDRSLVQIHSIFEDQLVESLFPESRLYWRMPHRLGVWPGAVKTGEVTGPEKVLHTNLRYAPKTALFLDFEREENLTLHELGRLVRQRDVGRKDPDRRIAPIVLTVEAPEQKGHPTDARLFEDEAHPGMAIADTGEHDGAHQFRHRPHGEVDDSHQGLIALLQACDPHPQLARPTARVGVQVNRQARLRGCRPDRLPHLVQYRFRSANPVEDDPCRQAKVCHAHDLRGRLPRRLAGYRQQHDEPAIRLLIQLPSPIVDDLHTCDPQCRILDLGYLLIGSIHEFSIHPVPIHIFAAIPGMGGAEDTRLRLLRHAGPGIAGDGPPAHTAPAHTTPGTSFNDPLSGAVRPLHNARPVVLELLG